MKNAENRVIKKRQRLQRKDRRQARKTKVPATLNAGNRNRVLLMLSQNLHVRKMFSISLMLRKAYCRTMAAGAVCAVLSLTLLLSAGTTGVATLSGVS